ncbi:DUF6276 family protein [Natrinema salinisoli]|uniref:DUF6276 family protein n=1 Tax=Natrinema salinisoli TaxID=2878535 RepID=UPI001CF0C909|nr:DUF6276 family protein [Natrinema salinisoli]
MVCSECNSATISVSVPEKYRTHAPSEAAVVSFCSHCLTLEPASSEDATDPDFSRVSDAFPTNPERAIPLALAIGLCSSLATNRSAIESLLEAVERAGADPLLVLDRLGSDPSVEPALDLERRRHQLEQLLY